MNPIKQATVVVGSACVALGIIAHLVPSAQAEIVICNINDVYNNNSGRILNARGTALFDFENQTAKLCWNDTCYKDVPASIIPTRTGFVAKTNSWLVRVDDWKYVHALFDDKYHPNSTANGVCY